MASQSQVPGTHPFAFRAKILSSSQVFFLGRGAGEPLFQAAAGRPRSLIFGSKSEPSIVGVPTKHAEDGVQHLAGDGDERLQFGFVTRQKVP